VTLTPGERRSRRRRRQHTEWTRWGVLVVFAIGIALGQALHDNPKPGGTVTLERTLSVPSGPLGSTVTP
jgi:hypothetical protein